MHQTTVPALGAGIHRIQLTTQMARELLASNASNRRVSPLAVKKYTTDIVEGRWGVGNDMIVVTHDGDLRNGQHRCWALLAAAEQMGRDDVTIDVFVRVQAPGETDEFDIFDAGKIRTAADVLSIHNIQYGTAKAAAAKMILLYDLAPNAVWSGPLNALTPRSRLTSFVIDNADKFEAAAEWRHFPKMSRSVWIALAYLISEKSVISDEFEEFHRGVSTGAELLPEDPRLALRNWIQMRNNPGTSRGWGGSQSTLAVHVKAWNKHVLDEPAKVLAFRRVELPMPKIQ